MTFWADSSFEPKRNFMWKLTLLSGVDDQRSIEPFRLKKVSRPKMSINKVEHNYLNRKFNFPGVVTWDNITATIVDDVGGHSLDLLKKYLSNSNYEEVSKDKALAADGKKTLSKQKLVGGLSTNGGTSATLEIQQLDSDGNVVETTYLYNAWMVSLTPSELDYSNEDLSTFDIEIAYDWAAFETPNDS